MFEQQLTRYLASLPQSRLRRLRNVKPLSGGRVAVAGRELIDFSSNDYLGLRDFEVSDETVASIGLPDSNISACSSRLLAGNHPLFQDVEQKVAGFKGTETALLFSSGFQLNTTVLGTLLSAKIHGRAQTDGGRSENANRGEPAVDVFVDRLAHASMHAGLNLAGVRQRRFRHNDLLHLRSLLAKSVSREQGSIPRIIVTESLFSMDGDFSNIQQLRSLAKEFEAVLYVDEAHAVGVCGTHGMGLMAVERAERVGDAQLNNEILIGTFSKSFTAFGGYVACSQLVKDVLINACPGLIYSTGLPPSVLHRISRMLEVIPHAEERRQHLRELNRRLHQRLKDLGLVQLREELLPQKSPSDERYPEIDSYCSPIVPIVIGQDEKTIQIASELERRGFLVAAVRPPTVPEGTARLRISLSAAHSIDDIDALTESLQILMK